MALEIKNAPISQKGRITDLCRETYEVHRDKRPGDWPGNLFDFAIQPMIEAAFKDKNGRGLKQSPSLFAAEKDGVFAGYYRLSHCPTDPTKDYFSVELQDIYVLPEFRRQGIGRALVNHAKSLAAKHDWDSLEASIADWHVGSRHLFEEQGFAVSSRKLRFGPDRAARDIPIPRRSRVRDWLWIIGGSLFIAFVILRLRS